MSFSVLRGLEGDVGSGVLLTLVVVSSVCFMGAVSLFLNVFGLWF